MKPKTYFILAATLLFSFLLVTQQACKKESDPTPPDNNEELSIPETTKVIDQDAWNSNFVGLDSTDYTITFKKELTNNTPINVNDIIVSKDGYGYLRKITSIKEEGGNIKVYTTFASLSEAIENGSFSLETTLSEQKIMKISYLKEGVVLDTTDMRNTEETAMEYDIDTYLDNNNKVHIDGSFTLLPSVNAELIIKWFKVKKLNIEFVVDEQISIENTIELVNIQYEKEIKLAGVSFHPITIMIGPVPVIIVPELEIFAGVELDVESTVTTSVYQSMNYTAGMLYENSEWLVYKELNKQLNYSPPALSATAEAKAYIKPKLNLKFYGTVAPYLAGQLYGRIEAELQANPWWSLYAGVNIGAGVEMEIFGKELFDYYTDPPIIVYEKLIVDANSAGGNQAPGLPFNPTPTNNAVNQSTNVDISWECSDPDNDPMTFDVYFGQSTNPELVLSNSTSTTYDPGTLSSNTTYYWKVIAKDDHEHATEGSVWQFTTVGENNEPPEPPSNPIPSNNANNVSVSTTLQWACSDPEEDPITFDVYFGIDNPPAIVATNQSKFSYNPGTLSQNTQYYWKVVTKDDHSNQTEGAIWTFATAGGGSGDIFTDPRDGQTYNIVTIGSQTWFAENLKYQTGNSWCYDNNSANCNTNGRLYDWVTAMDACPSGWHLPSDEEWKELEGYVDTQYGYPNSEWDKDGRRGFDAGINLKSNSGWYNDGNGIDLYDFTVLPGGRKSYNGGFIDKGKWGVFWTSSTYANGSRAWNRIFEYNSDKIYRSTTYYNYLESGSSVRCIKD